jgi:hypothetical protein
MIIQLVKSFSLWHSVVLWVNTHISKGYASSIFGVEANTVSIRSGLYGGCKEGEYY